MSRLPPFFALRALEAAARHRSYTRAADELAVTHGAVSQQIRRLEAELGARLFERRANDMIPTPEAVRLAGQVRLGLDLLHQAIDEFSGAGERDPLVLSVCPQFASRWLPSRLPRLLSDAAGANLELRTEDRLADFLTDGVDMAVRYGDGQWEGVEVEPLFAEVVFPVCSPKVAAAHALMSPRQLAAAPLLHQVHRPWSLWFEALGLPTPPQQGLLFDDSLVLYEAAAEGLGVALARGGLVDPDLESGRLVRPVAGEVVTELGFFMVWRSDSRKQPRIQALREWLAAEVSAVTTPAAIRAA